MKKNDHGIEIRKVGNGFVIKDSEGNETVARESNDDETSASEDLLNQIVEFFDLRRSRYDRERIRIVREVGDKYTLQKDEKIVRKHFFKLIKKDNI